MEEKIAAFLRGMKWVILLLILYVVLSQITHIICEGLERVANNIIYDAEKGGEKGGTGLFNGPYNNSPHGGNNRGLNSKSD